MYYRFAFFFILCICDSTRYASAQSGNAAGNIPSDYLTPAFHAARRQALRDMMPKHSVAIIFSYPEAVFSRDVDYVYHANPDLYYFSGYTEPDAVLLIFKETQPDGDSSYNELFFVQHRDPQREQWTGKRLGVEGVKATLGFKRVYNGSAFRTFPLDLKKFNLIYDVLSDTSFSADEASLAGLKNSFAEKAGVGATDKNLYDDLRLIYNRGNAKNLARLMNYIRPNLRSPGYARDSLIQELMAKPDTATLAVFKKKYKSIHSGPAVYTIYTNDLRGIKQPEELDLIKKAVEISGMAHAESMKAAKPSMSERELEGIMMYVHKKYGAENEGYPPIVGAGGNGCILHYEENNALELKNDLVLMDVGAMYHGYSADVTRTFPANGKFTEDQKAIYQLVYDAQEEAFRYCKDGTGFDSLESKTTQVLAAGLLRLGIIKDTKDVKKYYPHGMTHHLGLDVHDKGNYNTLQENMVITVEPGIYIPAGSDCDKRWWNIGVRIEDDVIIRKTAYTLLSADAPRSWNEIEKTMAEKSIFDAAAMPALK